MVVTRIKWSLFVMGLVMLSGLTSESLGQRPGGQGRGPGGRGFPGGFGGGPLELLQRPDVQAELELLDDQKHEARKLAEDLNSRRRELFGQFRGGNQNEDDREALRERVREAFQKLNQDTEESLSFLLPHQRTRLSQLEVQFRMRGGGALGALSSRQVAENLKVSDEQREKLRERGRELGQELRKKMAELQREFQDKLLAELEPEQRAKFQELVGDPFEFQDQGPGRGGRPGGGRPQRPERPANE